MPIRINLLAEAKAAEQVKRRDPVKFAIYGGILAVVIMMVWWSFLELKTMTANGNLARVQEEIHSKTNQYQVALTNQARIIDARKKIAALDTLTRARLLQGTMLDALQHATVKGVQLTRVRMDQNFYRSSGKNPTVTSKSTLYLDAKDMSASPGDQVNNFKEMLANLPYFKTMLSTTNGVQLINVSSAQKGADGQPYVTFQVQCDYAEVTR